MTTIAFHQYTNIPRGSSYSFSPIKYPQSHQTPGIVPNHNLGVLTGKHPNPPQFTPTYGFANARQEYARSSSSANAINTGIHPINNRPTSVFFPETHRSYLINNSVKYVAPKDSSLYLSTLKSRAIGKSSMKQGLPLNAPLSYKNYNTNDVKSALRYVRAGGSMAPKKQGSIYNKSRNGLGFY
jgi:hypothetical protein